MNYANEVGSFLFLPLFCAGTRTADGKARKPVYQSEFHSVNMTTFLPCVLRLSNSPDIRK